MNNSLVAMQTSHIIDLILLATAIAILIAILHFYLKTPVKKKNAETIETHLLSPGATASRVLPQTQTTPPSKTLTKKYEETAVSPSISMQLQRSAKVTRPFTSKAVFEETPSVTVDDFINFKGAHLLIVEDNKINQKILLSVLKRSGMEISVANNGQEALDFLNTPGNEFDLVLMDISMPVMDGYTATKIIREDDRFITLPIITLTAFAMGKEIQKMFDLGVNGYLTKPLNNRQLYTVFQTYLGHLKRPVSTVCSLKMKGLDIELGIAQSEGNEKLYNQKLREFISLYGNWPKEMPVWIEHKEYDRIKHNLIKIASKLGELGAYELDELVARMKKTFIYRTEHRIDEFKDLFSEKLSKLIIAMRLYLQDEL